METRNHDFGGQLCTKPNVCKAAASAEATRSSRLRVSRVFCLRCGNEWVLEKSWARLAQAGWPLLGPRSGAGAPDPVDLDRATGSDFESEVPRIAR